MKLLHTFYVLLDLTVTLGN